MAEQIQINEMRELIELKRESPEEYQEFLKGFEDVTSDIVSIALKIGVEVQKQVMKQIEEEEKNENSNSETKTYY